MVKRATDWSKPTDFETVSRRASGRRHYNSVRKLRAAYRQREIVDLMIELHAGILNWGIQSRIARTLGVHRSTVNRAIKQIMAHARKGQPCPVCGNKVLFDRNHDAP